MNSVAILQDRSELPATYLAARNALAMCERIDECQDWANKAAALASYAKQSRDDQLVIMAQRIQARAIRRCGELLQQVPAGNRGSPGRTAFARDAGMDRVQQRQASAIAQIPAKQFEQLVESDSPPRPYKLAQFGVQKHKPRAVAMPTCCPTCGRAL